MTQRVNFSILFCTISILTAQAQWNKQDSIRLQELLNGDGELKINTEAVKSIHFDFQSDKDNIKGTPIMSEDKPWMKFLKDLPKNFGDTTKWVRPNFVRLTPYTPYTTWHEDPVNDPIFLKRKDSLTISWKLNIKLIPGLRNGYVILPAGRINRPFCYRLAFRLFGRCIFRGKYFSVQTICRLLRLHRSAADRHQFHRPSAGSTLPSSRLSAGCDLLHQTSRAVESLIILLRNGDPARQMIFQIIYEVRL